jgi:hypothetical protein
MRRGFQTDGQAVLAFCADAVPDIFPGSRVPGTYQALQRTNGSLGPPCPLGELDAVEYLGTQKSGYDVYDVKYRNAEETFTVSVEPDGEIHLTQYSDPPNWVMPYAMVAVTAPAMQTLFRRDG